MKAFIFRADYLKSSKKDPNFDSFILQVVENTSKGYECKSIVIKREFMCGIVPQAGEVYDITYNSNGFVDTFVPDLTKKFVFNIQNVDTK